MNQTRTANSGPSIVATTATVQFFVSDILLRDVRRVLRKGREVEARVWVQGPLRRLRLRVPGRTAEAAETVRP